MVFTLPAFMSSGVVVPRGVSGMRYAVFIQKLSSGVSSTRIHETDLVQYVAKYPGTTSRTGNPFNIGSGSPFIRYATIGSSRAGFVRSQDFNNRFDPTSFPPAPESCPSNLHF